MNRIVFSLLACLVAFSAAAVDLTDAQRAEIEERISTAVQLLSSDDPDELRGSEQLLAEVVKAASLDVREVRPKTTC